MTYQEAVEFLYKQLPMYHRIGPAAYKENLDNIISLCQRLNNPEQSFKSVHIAGTNGKGSVSHFLASVLQEAGYKTALFTSPHLKDFRERIRINGKKISKDKIIAYVEEAKMLMEEIKPSFFELTTAFAFLYFAEEKPDIAVIETGLGGRLDSTNVINPLLSIITNVSLDHTNLLGENIEKIAKEKAGIIKNQTPVIIGEHQPEVEAIFKEKAATENAPVDFASNIFAIENVRVPDYRRQNLVFDVYKGGSLLYSDVSAGLSGNYQVKNLPAVFLAAEKLNELGFKISESNIRKGLAEVVSNTGLQGRWQILSEKPLVICDTAHNVAGMAEVIAQIENTPYRQLHIVFGMVEDKDIDSIIDLLPEKAVYYFCKPDIPRGLDETILRKKCLCKGLIGNSYNSVVKAYKAALETAINDDLVFIGGSTFVVAEVI